MTELYGWKPTSAAKVHLDEADARAAIEREAQRSDQRNQASRDWLAEYLSQPNRPTRFDWSPKLVTATKIEEIINAEAAEEAFRHASEEARKVSLCEGMGDAAEESGAVDHGFDRPSVDGTDELNDPIPF